MFSTLTSEGQVTVPKEIRDRLGLDVGSILDFELQADHTISVRQVKPDARRIRGLLKSPQTRPLTAEQMDEGIIQHVREKHAATSKGNKPAENGGR